MEFYKIHQSGWDIRVILATNKYEALGYYALKAMNGSCCVDDIDIEDMEKDHKIEVSCIGFPVHKTIEEIYLDENKDMPIPCIVCELVE